MPDIDIDALERLAKAATPGPWTHGGEFSRWTITAPGKRGRQIAIASTYPSTHADADATYIAAANPQTVLALIERVRRAESRPEPLRIHHGACDGSVIVAAWEAARVRFCPLCGERIERVREEATGDE